VRRHFTLLIGLGLILGLVFGALVHGSVSPAAATEIAGYLGLVTWVFLTLIKMVIAPLVFSTLTAGVAHMGGGKQAGRAGLAAMGWFLAAGAAALAIGLVMASLLQPGAGLHLPPPPADAQTVKADLTLKGFLSHVFPASIIDAMAKNEVLQIVVFSLFTGPAIASLGPRAAVLLELLDQIGEVMLKIVGFVMGLAPFAVFAAIGASVATHGLEVLVTYARFVGGFYLSLAIFWAALLAVAWLVLKDRLVGLLSNIREPALIAFSTASSEAAYPGLLAGLEKFGVSNRVASFVLPLGYSFNLCGSMMYTTFASLFIAQLYNIDLSIGQKIMLGLILMVTSKGIASVPRASLVVIAAVLPYFHIPEAGLLLILGVDQFLDMGRTCTNVLGNSVAAAAVAKWEDELAPAE
jgi:Na+/H+-dicarboxylate symporter